MKGIYNIRTLFEKYYSEYGNYIDAAAKFVTALILFMPVSYTHLEDPDGERRTQE